MSELHESVDYNSLKFEHVGPTKDLSFHEYKDSKELFNAKGNDKIKFSEVKNKQNDFLNKLRNIATDKKNYRTKRNYSKS